MSERGTDEGFSVPPDFRSQVWENVLGDDTSFDLFNVFPGEPTNSTSVNIQKDITNPWDTAGVKAFYVSEASQMQPSSMDQKMDNVPVHKLYAFVLATEELLSDSPRFNDRMTRKVGQAIRYKGSVALAAGNGVGRPLGFTKSGSVVTVAKETGQAAKTIVPQNIANMYSRLFNPQRGIWIISSDAFPQIMLLNLNGMPLWTPYNEGFKYRPNGMLLGQPIYISYHCQTLGTQGDIYFVNADGYMHLQRTTAPEFASSMHLYFDYDMEAFRWTIRHGGQPYMNQAISLPNGQASQSYFVQLATRS
jgi:HK97 family phage major capsid protein